VSFDDPEVNQAWAEEEAFEFELWSDEDRDLALYYGAVDRRTDSIPDRITKILDGDGTLVLEYLDVSVGSHPQDVLEDCTLLFGG